MMKKYLIFGLIVLSYSGMISASSDIEEQPIGYRKYYKSGYIEIKCDTASGSTCLVSVKSKARLIEKEIDLENYGYASVWEPIGAFLTEGVDGSEPISFYFSTHCISEDYALIKKSPDQVRCIIHGRVSQQEIRLENVEMESTTDDFSISRGLSPLNP